MEFPSLRQMLEAGVHFGHKTSRWHPRMEPYIFMAKAGVHVINLEKTEEKLKEAADFLANQAKEGKMIVFVGTKKQSREMIKQAALEANVPYVIERWLGGTLTNFTEIKGAIARFKNDLAETKKEDSELSKAELSRLRKRVARGEELFGGLVDLDRKPEVLVLFGSHDETNALCEAKNENAKIVAVVDTNADPSLIDYPIPANDDATKSIKIIADVLAQAVKEGAASRKSETQNPKTETNTK